MPDTTTRAREIQAELDKPGLFLAEVGQRADWVRKCEQSTAPDAAYTLSVANRNSARDVRPLLAAVEAVLAQHQPGRVGISGALCPRHENHRYFSITATEAADVVACQECAATVYDSCAGCGPQTQLDSCPARTAISRALLGDPNA